MTILKHVTIFLVAVLFLTLGSGCDLGVNPLLFDGTPVSAVFYVNTTGTSYSGSKTVNLNDIFDAVGNRIDSIKVFNITLQVDSTEGTPAGTTLTGTGTADDVTIVTMTNADITSLATEQSIFDPSFTAFTLNSDGVDALATKITNAFADRSVPHNVNFEVSGSRSTSTGSLKMKIIVRVYTQVYTTAS